MAQARKCDRCGTCFDPLIQGDFEMVRFQNPVLQSGNSLKTCRIVRRLFPHSDADTWIDLCPACTRDFCKFMGAEEPAGPDDFEDVDQ